MSKKYDVIFSDYNIGENKDGQDFITDIRKSNVNAEVLFYSALHNPPALGLDRISFLRLSSSSAYDDLKAKMKSMIDLTLEKLNDLTNLRGLVMAEVSELDIMMKQIVYHYCDDSEKEKKLQFLPKKSKKKFTKNNTIMAFVTIEDLYGQAEIIAFENAYQNAIDILINEWSKLDDLMNNLGYTKIPNHEYVLNHTLLPFDYGIHHVILTHL